MRSFKMEYEMKGGKKRLNLSDEKKENSLKKRMKLLQRKKRSGHCEKINTRCKQRRR